MVTLTVVYDNDSANPALAHGWGFSCLVSKGSHQVLFDSGNDGKALMRNLQALHVWPSAIEAVVVSHGHGDHTGGLTAFLAARPQVPVYLPHGISGRIVRTVAAAGGKAVTVEGKTELEAGIWVSGPLGGTIPEQALIVETPKGPFLVTGCSHPGIAHMIRRAEKMIGGHLYGLVGGLHLMSAGRARLRKVAAVMQKGKLQVIAAGHCTGKHALAFLKKTFPQRFCAIGAGKVIRLE